MSQYSGHSQSAYLHLEKFYMNQSRTGMSTLQTDEKAIE